jgi:small subunit ribosomal protein S11
LGLKGGRKSSVYAVQLCLERIVSKARQCGYKLISIRVSGIGLGRKFILRSVKRLGIRISSLQDITPRPHNGCRNRNKRRL